MNNKVTVRVKDVKTGEIKLQHISKKLYEKIAKVCKEENVELNTIINIEKVNGQYIVNQKPILS